MTAKLNTVKLPRVLVALLMAFAILLGTVATGLAVLKIDAADSYTTVSSGTVSWQDIYDNPGTYYWIDADGEYCLLTATKTGSKYYVTLYRSSKGNDELRYLRSDKSDDSASEHEWASASTKYTGGNLYKKESGGSSQPTPSTDTKTYQLVNTPTSGKKYIIINSSSKGSAYALTGTGGSTSITINAADSTHSAVYVTVSNESNVFTYSGTTSSFKLQNSSGQYLALQSNSDKKSPTTKASGTSFKYSSNKISGTYSNTTLYYELSSSNSRFRTKSSNGTSVYFYEEVDEGTKYTITWLNWDGSTIDTTSVAEGKTPTHATPSRTSTAEYSYTFTGWSPAIEPATRNQTYIATYTATKRSYTVTFNANGHGTAPSSQSVAYGSTANEPNTPTANDGYKFVGWYTDAACTNAYDFSTPITGNKTLYAKWVPENTMIRNSPSTATSNNLHLEKALTEEGNGTFTITLTAYATTSGNSVTTYTKDGYNQQYSYEDLQSGNYYYLYNGTYYQVHGLKYYSNDKGKYYYCGYFEINGTKYYLDKTPTAYTDSQLDTEHPGNNSSSKAYESCKSDKESEGKELPLYTKTTTGGTSYGTSTALKDVINTTNFDASSATANVVSGNGDASLNNGTLTVTGYNYSANWGTSGTHLVVKISGLTPKVYDEWIASNNSAGIYASSTSGTALVSVSSPEAYVPSPDETTYTVTWKNYDGTVLETDSNVKENATPKYNGTTPNRPQDNDNNYTFAGWTPEISPVTGDITYTATYTATPREYTVTWKNQDETVLETRKYKNGETPSYSGETPTKAADAKYTYTFNGWNPTISAINGANQTYTATYKQTLQKYTVKWVNDDGTVLETDENVPYGTTPTYDGATPTKASDAQYNYNFAGWTPEVSEVTGDTTYKATYTKTEKPKTYELTIQDITLNKEIGEFSGAGRSHEYGGDYGEWGYAYIKYSLDGTEYDTSDNGYRFVFESDDPSITKQGDDSDYETKKPKSDYWLEFKGKSGIATVTAKLYKSTDIIYEGIEPLATTTFTVTVYPFNITFKNGDETLEETTASLKQSPQYTKAEPTKDGYTFVGWSTNPNATATTGAYYPKGTVLPGATDNTTYYAVFEKNSTYTITWVNDDGTVLETDENVQAGATPSYDGATPSKASTAQYEYIFAGWTPEITKVNGDKTYTAVYVETPREYTVRFQYHDDTHVGDSWITNTKEYAYGTTPTAPSVKETIVDGNTTYTFTGWDREVSPVTGNITYVAQYKVETFIPETDASTDKKLLPTVTLLAVLATIATSAVLAADPKRRRRDEE